MFYSETLLSKTGPLAKIWLASNLERQLSKKNILSQNVNSSCEAIIDTKGAPMSLRLSGQLLLGVTRIQVRKTRYLLDDCQEAIVKIKLAFRPGNVDLPANQNHASNAASLTLPDTITELDLLQMPEPTFLLSQSLNLRPPGKDPTLLDFGSSGLLPSSTERNRVAPAEVSRLEDEELDLDIGFDEPEFSNISIEAGRNAPSHKQNSRLDDSTRLYDDDDLLLDLGDDPLQGLPGKGGDTTMGDMDDDFAFGGDDFAVHTPRANQGFDDRGDSPLSELGDEASFLPNDTRTTLLSPSELMAPQRVQKRRKILQPDNETELHASQIKAQQTDRSAILKPATFLPRDPTLLALLDMQKNGGFVSSILGNGRLQGWAPELRGIYSLEIVRRSGELKRKRDSGVADLDDEDERAKGTALGEIPHDDDNALIAGIEEPDDEGFHPMDDFDDDNGDDHPLDMTHSGFDDTTMPILHPADSGPISLGTRHAVHMLRDRLGPDTGEDSAAGSKKNIVFQDLLPETQTTRTNATKMFFEVLVLATKDAIKVEQSSKIVGEKIRVRGKRGLWGEWAERGLGGELASQPVPVA